MAKLRIGIVFGGRSGEHEVSLKSAQSVIGTLDPDHHELVFAGITKSGRWIIGPDAMEILHRAADARLLGSSDSAGSRPDPGGSILPPASFLESIDVVFPVLHGPFGEDGTIQGLFEMAGIAYAGCGVLASAAGMDKILFKDVLNARGIASAPFVSCLRHEWISAPDSILNAAEKSFGYPMFCKPANLGSSVGISKCRSREELRAGIELAAEFDRRILIEMAVPNAREIEVSVLGNDNPEASVPGEIIPSREFYDYQAKYLDDGSTASRLIIPADLPEETSRSIRRMAIEAFEAVDGSGMARVDFLVNAATHDVFLNEINTIPGFTSISMYPKLWDATGLPYPRLIERLIELAIERHTDRNRNRVAFRLEA